MSYRSIKRVLGETNIERKCRLLFGVCLTCLIIGAFYWVDTVAEGLVLKTTRSQARDLVEILLLRRHFESWDTASSAGSDQEPPAAQNFARTISKEFVNTQYEYAVLGLNDGVTVTSMEAKAPRDELEHEILLRLKERYDGVTENKTRSPDSPALDGGGPSPGPRGPGLPETPPPSSSLKSAPLATSFDSGEHIFEDRRYPVDGQYHYYAPVPWRLACTHCHQSLLNAGVVSAADAAMFDSHQLPFRVVRVVLPYKETKDAIHQARAILFAVAILTVFVAMLALYIIVRYVVVRPLKHLRDVSDDISRGKLETRADIRTGDEFQELAESFNRMLRHMTDTQANLRQVNSELDHKVDELAQLNMRLYEMNRLKGDFLANMSHELRTPLNSIIGFSEVLQGLDALNEKQRRYAQNIQKSGRVLLEMINDILDLAKMEAGKMDVRPTEFSIEALVQAQCDMVRSLAEEKNIDVSVQVAPELPYLFQDQGKIQQILTNLLSNAIKFTPEGGRIRVSARAVGGGRLELTVTDTGVGIAPEDREIIFEKFRQGQVVVGDDGLTRRYSGTGLGLSIVRELCKLLGGEVTVESEVGKGSSFRITVPWNRVDPGRVDPGRGGEVSAAVANREAWGLAKSPADSLPASLATGER